MLDGPGFVSPEWVVIVLLFLIPAFFIARRTDKRNKEEFGTTRKDKIAEIKRKRDSETEGSESDDRPE